MTGMIEKGWLAQAACTQSCTRAGWHDCDGAGKVEMVIALYSLQENSGALCEIDVCVVYFTPGRETFIFDA